MTFLMYLLLVAGVALWAGAHLFKRLAPERRASFGATGRGYVAVALLVAIVLMVAGFRGAAPIQIWFPPAFLVHVNNLLMLVCFYLVCAWGLKTRVARVTRHPLLSGFKAFAVAHLLVNGDLASLILFGGLLAWAVVSVVVINRATPDPAPPPPATLAREAGAVVGAVVALVAVGWVHAMLGVWPFPV